MRWNFPCPQCGAAVPSGTGICGDSGQADFCSQECADAWQVKKALGGPPFKFSVEIDGVEMELKPKPFDEIDFELLAGVPQEDVEL